MSRMIDLMRQAAVPSHIMRSAALGSLSLPPAEMIEILVYLTANPVFGKQARMTLAGWDEESSIAAAADPNTPREVLAYLVAPQNRRPKLVPALLENPSVEEPVLLEMAQADSRELVEMMLASARVRRSSNVLHALLSNPHLSPEEEQQARAALAALGESAGEAKADVLDLGPTSYELEHAAEIAAEASRAFELVDGTQEEHAELAATKPAAVPTAAAAAPAPAPAERERISPLQKIARMSVGERVQLAMKGSKDERFILIRDGSKVVSSAVLESPKASEQEIEGFAAMKNVQESVLRGIASKRKFMKNYAVVRALVNNPRCPLDVSLGLIKNLLVNDLKNLSINKNISDTIRKVGLKMFREKSSTKKGLE
jgi:hypothetical protein